MKYNATKKNQISSAEIYCCKSDIKERKGNEKTTSKQIIDEMTEDLSPGFRNMLLRKHNLENKRVSKEHKPIMEKNFKKSMLKTLKQAYKDNAVFDLKVKDPERWAKIEERRIKREKRALADARRKERERINRNKKKNLDLQHKLRGKYNPKRYWHEHVVEREANLNYYELIQMLELKRMRASRKWNLLFNQIEEYARGNRKSYNCLAKDFKPEQQDGQKGRNTKQAWDNEEGNGCYYFDWSDHPEVYNKLFRPFLNWELASNYYVKRINELLGINDDLLEPKETKRKIEVDI